MKKSILLLSGLGIGAGVLYAIGSRGGSSLKQTSTGNGNNKQPTDDVTENGKENRPSLTLASTREAGGDVAKKSSMAAADNGTRASADEDVLELDDQGTDQAKAAEILKIIRDTAFDSSNENLALALGRPAEEIEEEIEGTAPIDGDELMKVRNLAIARGINTP